MRKFVKTLAVMALTILAHASQAEKPLTAEEGKAAFNQILDWYKSQNGTNPMTFDRSRLAVPQTGRCLTSNGHSYWSTIFIEDKIVGADLGPGFPRSSETKIQLWGSWGYADTSVITDKIDYNKDKWIKEHHMQWMWKGISKLEDRGNELVWTLDYENNKRADLELALVQHQNYLVLVGKNLVAQSYPVRHTYSITDYYTYWTSFFGDGPQHAVAVGAYEIACYFFGDLQFAK